MRRASWWRGRPAWLLGLAVALLLSGVVSSYASAFPDGLEWVAAATGFSEAAADHAAASSPLADYQVAGVADLRWSGGLAGGIGTLTVLAIAGALTWALRRRPQPAE